jgi:hypothetical protein
MGHFAINWKTSLAGLAAIFTGLSVAYGQYTGGGIDAINFAMLFSALSVGVGLLFAKDATKVPPAAGIVLLLALALGAGVARAEDPRFGGCLKNGTTCFGPSVSLSVVAIDLKDGSVTSGVSPGVGYGVVFASDQWYRTGLAGYASFRDTSTGQRVVPSLVVSFAEYLRLGIGQQIGGGSHPFGILAIGADFGSVPTGAVK